tara:strand:- start:514 stop:1131 length:618 start_codon:yes stop_codon:yes gene_type:complete
VQKAVLLEAVLTRLVELKNDAGYFAPHDANLDKGYGKLNPDKQLSRQQNAVYPYVTPDQYDLDGVEDPEEEELLRKKSVQYITNDPGAGAAVNPFYFVGGNTKLSDCFERPDEVLAEIGVMQSSMNTVPQIYKGRGPSGKGAAVYNKTGNFRRTGSKRGYFNPPPESKIAVQLDSERNEEDYEPEVKNFEDALEIMTDTQRSEVR